MADWNQHRENDADALPPRPIRAAEYVRMSTDHQQYSTENQANAIRRYAQERGFEVVRTYADEGKSGLQIEGRMELNRLVEDVESGRADFSAILIYDVSRWGRFQDPDESAYHELRCKLAGVNVHYCAEQFENDGSPVSNIIKSVKRMMAGEYSRELSVKVFAGQRRLIELGFRQGGAAGFGLRRQLIDHTGARKGELARGEQKSIQTDRVVLVAGPREEVDVVRSIYRAFVEESLPERRIAEILNERGIVTDFGRPWTRGTVHQVLINEKYVGNNVWNRQSFKLKQERVHNRPEDWVRANGVFEPIIGRQIFEAAQATIKARSHRLSDGEMLAILRELLVKCGFLSGIIIDEADDCPSSSTYQTRFGSLIQAYQMVGFTPDRDYHYIEINRALRRMHPSVIIETIAGIEAGGGWVKQDPVSDLITVNEEFSASIVIVRCRQTPNGSLRWQIRLDRGLCPDLTIAVRMDTTNAAVRDYYILPSIDMDAHRLRLSEHNGISFDAYRFDSLDQLFGMAARTNIMEISHGRAA
ncbi:recombinase family protein [Bradyrhizobium sp. AZCC 2289]|uniref:recombinase family protein n=1 Tax=Bradyrhizobium sp. AZCC 2289 TaxID=3117026 RepID=UPI002FEFAD18